MMNHVKLKLGWRKALSLALLALLPSAAHAVTGTPVGILGSTGTTDNALLRADGTTGTIVQGNGVWTLSDAGALAAAGGTVTSSTPLLDLTQTWNSGATTFTLLKGNVTDTASAANSLLMDLQIGGVTRFALTKGGGLQGVDGSATAPTYSFSGDTNTGIYRRTSDVIDIAAGGSPIAEIVGGATSAVRVGSSTSFSWTATGADATSELSLFRDAANTLAQRNSTNAQAFRIYETFTDASNYERGALVMASDTFELKAETAGSGADNISLKFTPAGASSVVINGPPNLAPGSSEIVTGAITATHGYHVVDTEGEENTDDLVTINGGTTGDILILRAQADDRDVVVKDGTGNIHCAGEFTLDDPKDTITLIYTGVRWQEIARSNNE
jgi:hypothetical protein